jgi:hypothetical protein
MSRRVAFTALLAVLAWSVLAVPAQGTTGRHCSYRLVTVERHGRVNITEPQLIGCYATFSEALAAGSGGTTRVPSSMTPDRLTNADLSTGTRADTVLIGTEFNRDNFAGITNNYFAPTTCSSTNVWDVNYVGDAWNDMFESGRGFGGCDHNKKFQHADFLGDVLTCTPNCSDYGALSNEVSSLRWRP